MVPGILPTNGMPGCRDYAYINNLSKRVLLLLVLIIIKGWIATFTK